MNRCPGCGVQIPYGQSACYNCRHGARVDALGNALGRFIASALFFIILVLIGIVILLPGIIINGLRGRYKNSTHNFLIAAVRDWQTWFIALPISAGIIFILYSAGAFDAILRQTFESPSTKPTQGRVEKQTESQITKSTPQPVTTSTKSIPVSPTPADSSNAVVSPVSNTEAQNNQSPSVTSPLAIETPKISPEINKPTTVAPPIVSPIASAAVGVEPNQNPIANNVQPSVTDHETDVTKTPVIAPTSDKNTLPKLAAIFTNSLGL